LVILSDFRQKTQI